MNKNLLHRLYWAFWCSTAILNGILAGFMISHAIMLGRFFNWFVESGNQDLLRQTYTVFREASNAHLVYNIPLYLSFASGVIWVALALILKRDQVTAILAGLATFWTGSIFMLSDLDEAEEAVLTGIADPAMSQFYLSINLPIHTLFAVIYGVSLFLMLLIPLRSIDKPVGE